MRFEFPLLRAISSYLLRFLHLTTKFKAVLSDVDILVKGTCTSCVYHVIGFFFEY